MAIREFKKQISLLMLSAVIFSFSDANYALPFSIAPKAGTTLPTQISPGQTINALYTIINNTVSIRSGNFIKYLPPNVSQVTANNGIPDLCGSTFALQGNGRTGDSCTLELNVTGAVNGSDPDPHHHLFACFPGGLTCAGTNYPLNVSLINSANVLVAAGSYENTNFINYPGIATSNLQGTTWNQQVLPLPSGITNGNLNGASCNGNTCVAVGDYFNTNSNDEPAVARSTNGGNTWSQQVLTPPAGFNSGFFNGVSCVGNSCTAVGTYNGAAEQFAIANSSDGGNTWSQQALPLVSPYNFGILYGITCAGSSCVAVGAYSNASNYAAIAYTTNGGAMWSQVVLPLQGNTDEYLYGVSCSGSFCVAVGEDDNHDPAPGIAVSTNGGSVWTQTTLILPGPYSDGTLVGVSCNSSSHCVAVGSYSTPGGSNAPSYPAIAVTNDGGNTWSQQVLTALPAGFISGALFGVECTGNTCVAVGQYNNNLFNDSPAIAVSTDGGNTWSQQALTNPAGNTNGALIGIS